MDFIRVAYKESKSGFREFYPSLQALESQDLVIRGGQFVAIWDADTGLYSRRLSHVPDIIDRAFTKMLGDDVRPGDTVKTMRNFDNGLYNRLTSLIRSIGDMGPELDQKIVYADQTPTKADAATFKMPYSLSDAPCPVWNEIASTLYAPDQRVKFEWAIGSILTGAAATDIQKFYVFFGPPGSGKSTIMNVIEMLFDGHTAAFSAYDMGKADAQFSLEPFKNNPLVAIDQDGDLSRLELNKNLNSVVSHDKVLINSKGKNLYEIIPRSTLFVGSNDPVKISNRKSGLFRRLVDIKPSGNKFEEQHYHRLMDQVKYELGSIARHCIEVFNEHGPTYLSSYRSTDMMYRTNDIFNFVEDSRLVLSGGVSLKQAHKMWVAWCEETDTRNHYKQFQFRDLLMDYFDEFHSEVMINGERHRSWFQGLKALETFSWKDLTPEPPKSWLQLDIKLSLFDELMADMPAQEASVSGTPKKAWDHVDTVLKDIDTAVEHYVKVPTQHIVIDFDLKDEDGHKSLERNLKAAAAWPPTYAEVSRGGAGLHLHYDYDGDVERLANAAADGSYEVKTLLGGASLRRRLTLCNDIPVAPISSGLPLKEEKVLSSNIRITERGLREQILKGLRKGVHIGTKSNMDFIKMVTDEAYAAGLTYDVSDMWDDIMAFAMGSTNQKNTCIEIAMGLKLKSEEDVPAAPDKDEKPIAYFDCEVFPNLFAIGYMYDRDDAEVVTMLNPTPAEVESLFENLRLIGFNNRGYDNHILWARTMGASNEALYDASRRIIVENDRRAMHGPAYNAAYADAYDIIVEKKSLKRWCIDLGLPHMEMDHAWDEPVPDEKVDDVLEYLKNDVRATRAVCKHREGDFRARHMLTQLSGLAMCNTNRQHTERLIFPDLGPNEQPELEYTDLSEMFPGYKFDQFAPGKEKSTYRGEKVGEGGLVRAKPGMYENVILLDVASMHPTSIVELNLFGKYTSNFKALMDQRLEAKRLGKTDPEQKALSDALKIVINSVYGLTSASFPNKFKDDRNIDNIVAKRGALFMMDLLAHLEGMGYEWVHVKTDSVKIVLPDDVDPQHIVNVVSAFGKDYGYDFEHEATYERFCLVNDAVYVARNDGKWSATGAQFQHPIVFKTLFTKEDFDAKDYVEVKQVAKGSMYLVREETGVRQFVGRFGAFIPVLGGRQLLRVNGEQEVAVAGTKGYLWEIDETALGEQMDVDYAYFQKLVEDARQNLEKFGDYATFTRP